MTTHTKKNCLHCFITDCIADYVQSTGIAEVTDTDVLSAVIQVAADIHTAVPDNTPLAVLKQQDIDLLTMVAADVRAVRTARQVQRYSPTGQPLTGQLITDGIPTSLTGQLPTPPNIVPFRGKKT